MHLSYDDIIIAFDFTHYKQIQLFININYGFSVIHKDTVNITNIIDAFNEADDHYNNIHNQHTNQIKMDFGYDGVKLILYNITDDKTPPFIFNVIECDKQKYNDYFIESIKQTI